MRELLSEGGDRGLGVGNERMVRPVDLVDLLRQNIDVDERLVLEQVGTEVEGRVLRERVADGEDDICVDQGLAGGAMAAVGENSERQRVVFWHDSLAVEGGGERDLEALDQSAKLWSGTAADRAEADERNDGLALPERLRDGAGGRGNSCGIGKHRSDVKARMSR
jgi:hypothetical protein